MLRAVYRVVTYITQEITTRKISLYMFSTCSADGGKQMQKFTSTKGWLCCNKHYYANLHNWCESAYTDLV